MARSIKGGFIFAVKELWFFFSIGRIILLVFSMTCLCHGIVNKRERYVALVVNTAPW